MQMRTRVAIGARRRPLPQRRGRRGSQVRPTCGPSTLVCRALNLVVAWLLFPLLTGLIALGCGLLVDRGAGTRLPGVLLAPLGLATIVVASQVTTHWGATARLATPLVLVLAVAGYALSAWRVRAGVDTPAAATAL